MNVTTRVRSARSVAESFALLTALVAEAKAGSPLERVTVIVRSHRSGLDVTRHLARKVNDGRGVLNVHAHTLADIGALLHERCGAGAGRSLVSSLVREGAVRAVLADNPGDFVKVADQPATAAALSSASSSLDVVDTRLAMASAPSALTQEVLRVHASVRSRLEAGWFTEHDQFTVALHRLETDPADIRNALGTVIAFLLPATEDLDLDPRRLLEALRSTYSINDIAMGPELAHVDTRVISATDPDDEARSVARRVVDIMSQGTPANRIGVFWGAEQPYRALLHRHLADAAVAVNGPAARQLHDTAIVRGVIALLTLDPSDVDLRRLFDVLAEGVLNWSVDQLPSSAQLEKLHGTTPIEDLDEDAADGAAIPALQFMDLEALAEEHPSALAEQDPDSVRMLARQREALSRQRLVERYVDAVSASLAAVNAAESWAELSDALEALVAEHFSPRTAQGDVLEHTLAREGLQACFAALRMLDGIAPSPSAADGGALSSAAAALESELGNHQLKHSKAGVGVSLGPLGDAVARDLDVVIAVGLAEGIAPGRHRDDPLLPDQLRELWGNALPTLTERAGHQKRRFLAALASASTARIVTYPRGDLRGGGDRLISRWLSDLAVDAVKEIGSYHDGIVAGGSRTERPVSGQQWRMRHLRTPVGNKPDAPADDRLDAAWSMRRARATGEFGRYTGDLSSLVDHITVLDGPVTATSLEDWVASPLSYFLGRVLGLRPFEDVQLSVEIDQLTRGILLHEILEKFTLGQLAGEDGAGTQQALLELAETTFDTYRGSPGARNWLAHLWERDKRSMRTDLRLWWERIEASFTPHSAEAPFGHTGAEHESVPFSLTDGTTIRFSGKVDRIDWTPDGRVHVVDYKAGKAEHFAALTESNPTADGTKFQLPIYGLFARREAAEAGVIGPLHAEYDFVTRRGGQQSIGYEVTDDVLETLRTDISEVVAAIRAGIFPPVPGSTTFTSFTTLMGAPELKHLWRRVRNAPALAPNVHFWPAEDEDS